VKGCTQNSRPRCEGRCPALCILQGDRGLQGSTRLQGQQNSQMCNVRQQGSVPAHNWNLLDGAVEAFVYTVVHVAAYAGACAHTIRLVDPRRVFRSGVPGVGSSCFQNLWMRTTGSTTTCVVDAMDILYKGSSLTPVPHTHFKGAAAGPYMREAARGHSRIAHKQGRRRSHCSPSAKHISMRKCCQTVQMN
jgi:hypothetical protein